MKNFKLTFYFEKKRHEVKVSAEQLGLNFGLAKILSDLSDGTNTFAENDKVLAECHNENKSKEEEYQKLINSNDVVWEYDGKRYFIVIPACEDHYIEIYDEDREYVGMSDYYLTLID